MATVREKAAALNLSGVFFSPMPRPPDHRMANKPFQATYIWSSIINNLQSQVEVKRRRHKLKSHDDCFLGSEAVDVILAHVVQNKLFGDADIPRAKVVRVCQTLMDRSVFEAVGTKVFGKEKKQAAFEDRSFRLYRFLNTESNSTSNPENEIGSDSSGFHGTICSTPCRQDEPEYLNITPVKTDKSFEDLLGNLHLNPAHTPQMVISGLSQTMVSKVWQEQTVMCLLQLVELPLLDSLLEGLNSHLPPLHIMDSDPDLLFPSYYLDREILKAFSDSQADNWLSAAVDCLDFLPDQLVVEVSRGLPRCSDQTRQSKPLLFDALAKHYGRPACPPLLTNYMFDIHGGITELLVNGKLEQALEALQLCLKLLDSCSREELRRLLCFMAVAADTREVKLHREIENRMAVKRAFSRAIVHSRHLAKGKLDLLVLFLLDNHIEVFKIPGSLHKLVSDKLANIVHGKDPDVMTGLTCCRRVTGKAYAECINNTTKEELLVLLRTIHENPKLSAKEKRRLLGQFYKGHPEIFVQYFGSRISSVGVCNLN
ncbi:hypothetical protein AAFF_G00382770 [Aldrovandia affinis]|uniref:DEP domain-containing protein 7 n=1 Tax=Aldrovandia affinis TaxID=143900 RepID=A0AAD7T8E8_9TELE|nr:hypothetical protein AAFF_G00382770 [Aldrovandia affinis]